MVLKTRLLLALLGCCVLALKLDAQTRNHEFGLGWESLSVYSDYTDRNDAITLFYRYSFAGGQRLGLTYRLTQFTYYRGALEGRATAYWTTLQYSFARQLLPWLSIEPVSGLELRPGREFRAERINPGGQEPAYRDLGRRNFFDVGISGGVRVDALVAKRWVLTAESMAGDFFNRRQDWFWRYQVGVGVRF